MRKMLPLTGCVFAAVFLHLQTTAQVKGDPVLTATPQQLKMQKTNSLLSPDLQRVYDGKAAARIALAAGDKPIVSGNGMDKFLQIKDGSIVVDITVRADMAVTRATLQRLGLRITGVYGRVVSGIIPIAALPKLENVHTIQFARPAYKPMRTAQAASVMQPRYKVTYGKPELTGPVISQGDTAQRSYLARKKYNVSGSGIKVGIISDSYNNLGTAATGVRRGELPGASNPFGYAKPVVVLEDRGDSSGTDEGRAMAEIIHDVAPGAELAFHTADIGEADFAQGIQDLADAGCKVIVDDVSYFDEPFFQDGILAQSVDAAKKKGVAYFSAAGNESNSSYESDYRASLIEMLGPGNGTAHNWSSAGMPPRYTLPINIPSGGTFIASFQWDQPAFSAGGAGATSDLDIFLLDGTGSVVALGATDNIGSGDPIELIGYLNQTPNQTFFLLISKFKGPDPSHLKFNMYYDAQFYNYSPAIPGVLAPTLTGHPKADGAIATGAVYYYNTPAYGVDTPKIDSYSSLGGVPNYFDVDGNRIAPLFRRKPEIAAPDGGNTSFFNPFGNGDILQDADSFPNFFGTSAAAPHAAGVAALMLEAEKLKNLTPVQIKGILSAKTIDMDNIYTAGFDKGFDYNTGYGFIKGDEAVGKVNFPNLYIRDLKLQAVCSPNPAVTRSWKIINPNPFEVETHWLLLGSSQHGTITAPPGETIFSSNTFNYGYSQLPNIVILDWDDNFSFTRLDLQNSSNTACGNSSARAAGEQTDELQLKPMIADVYPNPATTSFRVYLALADQQPIDLQLFSIDGKKLLEKRVTQGRGIVPIDAMPYKPGVYLLQVKQGNFNKTLKLIKQ